MEVMFIFYHFEVLWLLQFLRQNNNIFEYVTIELSNIRKLLINSTENLDAESVNVESTKGF